MKLKKYIFVSLLFFNFKAFSMDNNTEAIPFEGYNMSFKFEEIAKTVGYPGGHASNTFDHVKNLTDSLKELPEKHNNEVISHLKEIFSSIDALNIDEIKIHIESLKKKYYKEEDFIEILSYALDYLYTIFMQSEFIPKETKEKFKQIDSLLKSKGAALKDHPNVYLNFDEYKVYPVNS